MSPITKKENKDSGNMLRGNYAMACEKPSIVIPGLTTVKTELPIGTLDQNVSDPPKYIATYHHDHDVQV